MVIWPSPTPFESLTYWYRCPRGGCFGRGCSMQSTFSLHFVSSILYGGIRRSWCRGNLSIICICSIVIFPLGRLSPPLPTAPRLFPNPEQVQPPDPRDRSRQWPRNQLFIMDIGICIPCPPAHDTTICLSTLWHIRSPVFLVLALTRLRRVQTYGYQISSLGLQRTKEMIRGSPLKVLHLL